MAAVNNKFEGEGAKQEVSHVLTCNDSELGTLLCQKA
uniref:Uncharacterized protein n=1 Tax=Anguilla anguilla TaxID=7936 RepID=A0A0E9TTV5_ANGAN